MTPVLLVATDFDGTVAPIVEDPDDAVPHPESVEAIEGLAGLPATHVGVISGRSRDVLAALLPVGDGVHLIGSHGAELDARFEAALPAEARALRQRLTDEVQALVGAESGLALEEKPASVAFHYRNAEPTVAARVRQQVLDGPGRHLGVEVKQGKMVVELLVVSSDKGQALDRLRQLVEADAVLFMGDDVTDEDAFARLSEPGPGGSDVGVKVGGGETAAGHRIDDTLDAAQLLVDLYRLRRRWAAVAG